MSIEGFLDADYNPNQFYIQSTGVLRTMQSSYAELYGMYPPKDIGQVTNPKHLPQLKIRAQLPESIILPQPVPNYSYQIPDINDDLNELGCPYAG